MNYLFNRVPNLFGFGYGAAVSTNQMPIRQQPDQPFANAVNWKNSVVAGSFALHLYTSDTTWQPADVDIMVACTTPAEFEQEAQKFEQKSGAILTKSAWFDGKTAGANKADELFHEKVMGSRTYTIPFYDKPVQLICLKQTNFESAEEILSETSDIPACVSYKMYNGQRIYNVPEKGVECLRTKHCSRLMVCPSRMEKYRQRGYFFD
jgi:hypothetical protein